MKEQKDERTLQQLAEEAYLVQDACNLSGVVLGMGRAVLRLKEILGSDFRRDHPICQLWADKIAHLAGTQYDWDSMTAYEEIRKLREDCEECCIHYHWDDMRDES